MFIAAAVLCEFSSLTDLLGTRIRQILSYNLVNFYIFVNTEENVIYS